MTPLLSILAVDPQKDVSGTVCIDLFEKEWRLSCYLTGRYRLCESEPREISRICADLVYYLPLHGTQWPRRVIVEGQYFGKNPQTFAALVRARAFWEASAAEWGLECEVIQPSEWQSDMLGKGDRKTLAQKTQVVFAQRFPDLVGETISEHVKSAALLGVWYAERWLFERRAK